MTSAYLPLCFLVAGLRFAAGGVTASLGIATLRAGSRRSESEAATARESNSYLLFLLAFLLVLLTAASWPLFYLLLESYVGRWPGAMCMYGITQIGKGSLGASRFLPGMVSVLEFTRPALVLAAGVWLALYRLNRSTATAPWTRRVVSAALALGVLAMADSALELSYLAIPKVERTMSTSCCTSAETNSGPPSTSNSAMGDFVWIGLPFFALHGAMSLALIWRTVARGQSTSTAWLPWLFCGACLSLPTGLSFLRDVAAPHLLRLPYHHCVYCLLQKVGESPLGVLLSVGGSFAVISACLAHWIARRKGAGSGIAEETRALLFLGCVGYVGSLAMVAVQLLLTLEGS